MYSRPFRIFLCFTIALAPLSGCRSIEDTSILIPDTNYNLPSSGPSYLEPCEPVISEDVASPPESLSPDQMLDYNSIEYFPISLEECIQRALADSDVFRDLGGIIVTTPFGITTTVDPALIYTNPTFGEDAALSAFDAEYSQSVIFEKNDRPFNNPFTGDTRGLFQQDFGEFNFQMTKLSATGTRFTSRGIINYDDNSQAGNRFFHSWETILDNEFRHPLLQGSGVLFNRIAGPSQVPGSFNGVLIARTNTEIGLAEFQTAVRDFIVRIENAYWGLYYSYRELNAQISARDAAFEVYKSAQAKVQEKRVSTLESASAYEQYLRFETAIVESLEGRPAEGTQSVFRRSVGVRIAERQLRYLIGMPITDGLMLKPSDKPDTTPVVFDWEESVISAMENRPETRRQRWVLKQRELQLIASKNFLLPRLDVVGRYRLRGLGRDLTGGEPWQDVIDSNDNNNGVSGAFADLGSLNFQEWQLGVELRTPVGFRQAHAGVRNAELATQRARMILEEQERKILLDLSNAVADVRRSWTAMSVASQRYDAAIEYRSLAAERIERGRAQFDVLLEAQRRVLESQTQFNSAEVDNAIALRNVHLQRGTLLQFHGVALAENESDPGAYISAARRQSRRKRKLNYILRNPTIAQPLRNDQVAVTNVSMLEPVDMSQKVEDNEVPSLVNETLSGTELTTPPSPTAAGTAATVRSQTELEQPDVSVNQGFASQRTDRESKSAALQPILASTPFHAGVGEQFGDVNNGPARTLPNRTGAVLPADRPPGANPIQSDVVIQPNNATYSQPDKIGAVMPRFSAPVNRTSPSNLWSGALIEGNSKTSSANTVGPAFVGAVMPQQNSTRPYSSFSSNYAGANLPSNNLQNQTLGPLTDQGVVLPRDSVGTTRAPNAFQAPGVVIPSTMQPRDGRAARAWERPGSVSENLTDPTMQLQPISSVPGVR